jgi:integrase
MRVFQLLYHTPARASELVAFNLGNIIQTGRGAVVVIRRSKTDQEGRGKKAALLPDAMRRVRALLATGQDREGPDPSLSHKAQNDRIRRRNVARIFAKRVGPKFSAHSARVGTAQDMLARGFNTEEIAQAGRWVSETMFQRYAGDLASAIRLGLAYLKQANWCLLRNVSFGIKFTGQTK